jgi:hypothetical protein
MAEVVDSIVAELIARDNGYIATFDKATAAHQRFKASVDKLKVQTFDLGAEGRKYKAGADMIAQADEQSAARSVRAKKSVSDADKAAAAVATAAAKAVEKAKDAEARASAKAATAAQKDAEKKAVAARAAAEAVVAASEREAAARARISAMVDRSLAGQAAANTKGPGTLFGSTTAAGGSAIPHSPIPVATAEVVVAETEVNHLLADQADLQARLTAVRGRDRDIIREQIVEMRLLNQYRRAGLTDEEAAVRAEAVIAGIEAKRAENARRAGGQHVGQFAAGAGLGRFGGLNPATAGIATAIGVGVGVAAIGASVNFAKELQSTSQALGLTTTQLQVYQRAAADVNVSNEQLRSSFGQYSAYLGRAREGDEQATKAFKALGVNIKGTASAGDLLPTLIQRISSIADPAQRAAVETRIFGEEGRRLDPLLSGGVEKVNDLAEAMDRAGSVLSPSDIKTLQQAGVVLAGVKQQLEVDVAKVVAGNADAIKSLADSFGELLKQLGGVARILKDEGLSRLIFTHNQADVNAAADPVAYLKQVRLPALDEAQRKFRAVQNGAPSERVAAGKDLANEIRLTQEATARAKASQASISPDAQPGKVGDLANLYAPKGKSAEQLAREAAARAKRFNDQMARLDEEQLRARADQTSDEQERSAIQVELINRERKAAIVDIQGSLDYTKAQKGRLVAAQNAAADAKIASVELHDQLSTIQRTTAAQTLLLDQKDEELQAQQAIATTAAERRRIEKALLADAIERERLANQDVLDRAKAGDPSITQQDIATAKSNIDFLPKKQATSEKSIDQNNLGPLASYLKTLPTTVDKVDEALQQAAADGLSNLNDGLTTAIGHFLHLHGLAGQFLEDLIKIGVEREIIAPLANILFPEAGAAAGIGKLFGFATGGSFMVGGKGGIDSNVLSINGRPSARVNQGERIDIVPANMQASRGGGTQITNISQSFHLDARYGITTPELLQYVNQTANSAAANAGAASFKASQAAAPARMQKLQTLGNVTAVTRSAMGPAPSGKP